MFGQSATDIVGRQFSALFPDCPSRSDKWGAFEPSASNDGFVEREALHADGSRFPTELSFASIGEADERIGCASIIRDISRDSLIMFRTRSSFLVGRVGAI